MHCLFIAGFEFDTVTWNSGFDPLCKTAHTFFMTISIAISFFWFEIFSEKGTDFIFLFLRFRNFYRLVSIPLIFFAHFPPKLKLCIELVLLNLFLHDPFFLLIGSFLWCWLFRCYSLSCLSLFGLVLISLNFSSTLIAFPGFFKFLNIFEPKLCLLCLLVVMYQFFCLLEGKLELNHFFLAKVPDRKRQQIVIFFISVLSIVFYQFSRCNFGELVELLISIRSKLPKPGLLLVHHFELPHHHSINKTNFRLQNFALPHMLCEEVCLPQGVGFDSLLVEFFDYISNCFVFLNFGGGVEQGHVWLLEPGLQF